MIKIGKLKIFIYYLKPHKLYLLKKIDFFNEYNYNHIYINGKNI